jgi:hypothetical protein
MGMTYRPRNFNVLLLAICLFLMEARDAHAYLDPGTGSYIIQIVIAAIFAGWFAAKYLLRRIVDFFSRLFSPRKKDDVQNRP